MVLWESASRKEGLSPDALRRIAWTSVAARECAEATTGLSDSGLETMVVVRLSAWGMRIRQQAVIAGRPVDVLIGERLIVQLDGFAYHSKPADRRRDLEHDAELCCAATSCCASAMPRCCTTGRRSSGPSPARSPPARTAPPRGPQQPQLAA